MNLTKEELDYLHDSEIYKIFGQVAISTISTADLVTAIKKINVTQPENEILLRWALTLLESVSMDGSARAPVVEQNSSQITTNGSYHHKELSNLDINAFLSGIGLYPYTTSYALLRADFEITLSAGGTAGPTQIVEAVAGKQIQVHHCDISMAPKIANLGATGGNSALIHLQDDAETPEVLGHMVCSNARPHDEEGYCVPATVSKDLDMVVEAGPAGHVDESILHGHVLYRLV